MIEWKEVGYSVCGIGVIDYWKKECVICKKRLSDDIVPTGFSLYLNSDIYGYSVVLTHSVSLTESSNLRIKIYYFVHLHPSQYSILFRILSFAEVKKMELKSKGWVIYWMIANNHNRIIYETLFLTLQLNLLIYNAYMGKRRRRKFCRIFLLWTLRIHTFRFFILFLHWRIA